MTLIDRFKRRLGYNTTATQTFESGVREYTVTHLNGEVTECRAHYHDRDEGFLLLKEFDDETWAKLTVHRDGLIDGAVKPWSSTEGREIVKELEGIKEVEYEVVGKDIWDVTVDFADHTIVDVDKHYESYDNE